MNPKRETKPAHADLTASYRASEHYADNVFVNCPFDAAYLPIFDAVIFAVLACGFIARSALEITDSSEVRIDKICRIPSGPAPDRCARQ
jgi:hypothetical protein